LRHSTRNCASASLKNKYKKFGGGEGGKKRESKERKTNLLYFDVLFHVYNVQRTPQSGLLEARSLSRPHASGSVVHLALLSALATGYSGLHGRRDVFIASGQFMFYIVSSIKD
jgi:hypothetical protein